MVFKSPDHTKESLLLSLYSSRKEKYEPAALLQLECLLTTIATKDKNGAILRYLLTLDGPAYTCHRYWDWIEPHV